MKGRIVRSIAVVAAGSVLALASAGIAAADVAGGKGNSSTEAAGAQVLQLRDQLTKVAYAGDVNATKGTLGQLNPLLGDLSAGQRYSIEAAAKRSANLANGESNEAYRVLTNPSITPRQVPPVPSLPKLPPPLDIVSNLLQNLLTALTGLLGGLLGSAPALPVPAPGLPVPVPTP
jgi:hypothetical protein